MTKKEWEEIKSKSNPLLPGLKGLKKKIINNPFTKIMEASFEEDLIEPKINDDEELPEPEFAIKHREGNKIEVIFKDGLTTNFENYDISVIEFAIYNSFLADCMIKNIEGFKTISYGELEELETVKYGTNFQSNRPWWFIVNCNQKEYKDNNILFQTRIYRNSNGDVCCQLNISFEKSVPYKVGNDLYKIFKKVAFNNSEYKGKCLEIKVVEGAFEGITIIPSDKFETNLILTEIQERFILHFEKRVLKGSQARYLLNGIPGSGKTQVIRRIMKNLIPKVTFITPIFQNSNDLKTVLEACEVFDPGCIVIDDIDIYIGNRESGGHTRLLADFLTYFDGIKKRNISILASTNNKAFIDKAAERPGRFNITLDFSYLIDDQIEDVVNMHLPKKWRRKEIYDALRGNDNQGKKINVTGAFIANLSENIIEMSSNEKSWSLKDTLTLIKDSYAGFYNSQTNNQKKLGFV